MVLMSSDDGVVQDVAGDMAPAVDQHERALGAEPAQIEQVQAAVPRKRVELDWLKVLSSAGSSLSTSPTEVVPVWKNSSP